MATPALPLTEQLSMLMAQMQAQGSKLRQDPVGTLKNWNQQAVQAVDPFFKLMQRHPEFPMVGEVPLPPGAEWDNLLSDFAYMSPAQQHRSIKPVVDVLRAGPLADELAAQYSKSAQYTQWAKNAIAEALAHPDRRKVLLQAEAMLRRAESHGGTGYLRGGTPEETWLALKDELQNLRPMEQAKKLSQLYKIMEYHEPDLLSAELSKEVDKMAGMPENRYTDITSWLTNALPEAMAHSKRPEFMKDIAKWIDEIMGGHGVIDE